MIFSFDRWPYSIYFSLYFCALLYSRNFDHLPKMFDHCPSLWNCLVHWPVAVADHSTEDIGVTSLDCDYSHAQTTFSSVLSGERGSGVIPIPASFRFWGLFAGQQTSCQQWNQLCFLVSGSKLQQVMETCKHLVRSLFATLQAIPRIWWFRTKLWCYSWPFFPTQNTDKSISELYAVGC